MEASTAPKAKRKTAADKRREQEEQEASEAAAAASAGALQKGAYLGDDDDDDDDLTAAAGAVIESGDDNKGDAEEAIEVFDPLYEARRWIIGKSPEHGGKETEYSIYVQDTLGFIPRMRFFALVSNTIAKAMKAGVDIDVPGLDFSSSTLTLKERAQLLTQGSLESGSDFMHLALQLVGYSPTFLLQCYVLWLDVPRDERGWAMEVMAQPWKPERGKWGLKDEDGMAMIETFIDQNYEDMRKFFTRDVPLLLRRVRRREQEHQDRASTSAQSKQ